jgi:predicted metal-dependent hydrolase
MESMEPDKRFYQGVLQIAVALYHLSHQNWRGAAMLMGEGIRRLDYYQPEYSGINVEQLVIKTSELLQQVQQAEVENMGNFDHLEIPQIQKL